MLKLTPFEETAAGQELLERGIQRALRGSIIEVLEVRFGEVPELISAFIQRIDNSDILKALHRQAVTAESLEAFEGMLVNMSE